MIRKKYAIFDNVNRLQYNIPRELLQLLGRDSYSLLIKGPAGSGKTTLALTILRTLEPRQGFLYVSTRNSQAQVFRNHPWLSGFLQVAREGRAATGSRFSTERGVFVDARLDEQSNLFETITSELMEIDAPLIIIDSWDAIGNLMDTEALLTNARVLQTWRERARAKLIFINEDSGQRTFDFLVDGIAALRQRYAGGRIVREILFPKLLGIEISRPSYFFSLSDGIFRSFDPRRSSDFLPSEKSITSFRSEEEYSMNLDHLSTRHLELDKVLGGGFPRHSVVLIKVDANIHSNVPLSLFENMIKTICSSGGVIIFHSFCETEIEKIAACSGGSSLDSLGERLTVLFPSDARNNLLTSKPSKFQTGFLPGTLEESMSLMRERFPGRLIICILELREIVRSFVKDGVSLREAVELFRRSADLCIIVTGESEDQEQVTADVSLEIVDMRGTLFLRPNVPYSRLLAITSENETGNPDTTLKPMV